MSVQNDDIIREFIVESLEALDRLDQELVALEQAPDDKQIINSIFRIVHTIKGTCGFLGFKKLESITHVGENLLDSVRSGKLILTPGRTTALLKLADTVREVYSCIEESGEEGDKDYTALIEQLVALNVEGSEGTSDTQRTSITPHSSPQTKKTEDVTNFDLLAEIMADSRLTGSTPEKTEETAPTQAVVAPPSVTAPPKGSGDYEEKRGDPDRPTTSGGVVDSSLRVDVALLDQLMNLVGELVLARNQILQITKSENNAHLVATSQRLNLITSELQGSVMKTRMQPIANVWNKFPRVVRDVARICGKEVSIRMEGKETDLDKTIIEAIKDPLTHIVRNAVDHGIELPAVRAAAGKPREGSLFLKACHEGGCVIIEISDDGAGIDPARIKAKAVEKGLLRADEASKMVDRDVFNLIFAPGFSTAEQVTNISGRGVGMDVVRSNIEKIGGLVDISSTLGRGSTFTIKIPLTLAIVPALTVRSAGERFLIPQVSLLELVRVTEDRKSQEIETVQGAQFYRLRGQLLPLVFLNRELELSEISASAQVNIVVVKADRSQFGLVVDTVEDTEEIVVKPLGKQLKDIPVFAGAAIMGDGRVALVIDVSGLARRARITAVSEELASGRMMQEEKRSSDASESLIIFNVQNHRVGMPLSLVNRLEQFPTSSIERSRGHQVVQYRGSILPLVDLGTSYGGSSIYEKEMLEVVVYGSNSKMVGIVVDEIVDIVDVELNVERSRARDMVMGTAIVDAKVTDILDVQEILRRAGYEITSGMMEDAEHGAR